MIVKGDGLQLDYFGVSRLVSERDRVIVSHEIMLENTTMVCIGPVVRTIADVINLLPAPANQSNLV